MWCDRAGNKFRAPYLASIVIAMLGGALYLLASLWNGAVSIALILLGRFLSGAGAANSTLGFTYVAQVIPKEHMTKANSLLTMVRIAGMVLGPAMNGLLGNVDATLGPLKLDPLNSVGLVLVLSNLFGFLILYYMLEEPPELAKAKQEDSALRGQTWLFWKSVMRMDILVPLLVVFSMNANFQLLETGLAPAASDAMGWTPTTISAVFGGNAVVILVVVLLTFKLAAMGVKDIQMIQFGQFASIIAYGFMYQAWRRDVSVYEFISPSKLNTGDVAYRPELSHRPLTSHVTAVVVCTFVFPFLGAPTRSIYTVAVAENEILAAHQGTMQAIMSMVASIAGFAAPSLIAAYVLRSPEQVANSDDQRELTLYALFAPILSLATLIGVVFIAYTRPEITCKTPAETEIEERQALLAEADGELASSHMDANRRTSVTLMHIPQVSFHHEIPRK